MTIAIVIRGAGSVEGGRGQAHENAQFSENLVAEKELAVRAKVAGLGKRGVGTGFQVRGGGGGFHRVCEGYDWSIWSEGDGSERMRPNPRTAQRDTERALGNSQAETALRVLWIAHVTGALFSNRFAKGRSI